MKLEELQTIISKKIADEITEILSKYSIIQPNMRTM